jgi:IS4 transposase
VLASQKGVKRKLKKGSRFTSLTGYYGDVVEVTTEIEIDGTVQEFRVVGFWHVEQGKPGYYHWYITNLTAKAEAIYPVYRLRWQVELSFKGLKNNSCFRKLRTSDITLIERILQLSQICSLMSTTNGTGITNFFYSMRL